MEALILAMEAAGTMAAVDLVVRVVPKDMEVVVVADMVREDMAEVCLNLCNISDFPLTRLLLRGLPTTATRLRGPGGLWPKLLSERVILVHIVREHAGPPRPSLLAHFPCHLFTFFLFASSLF